MENSSDIGKIKRALQSRLVRFKGRVRQRLIQDRLAKLVKTKKRFRAAKKSPQTSTIPQGVNLVAYIRAEMGLGTAARGMASAFAAAQIPFKVINVEQGNYSRHRDRSWSHKEARSSRYDLTVVCVNPDNSFHLRTQVPVKVLGDRYVIASWFWELPELPDEWLKEFDFVDEVWAASQFIQDAMALKAPGPVVRIPPVVQLGQPGNFSRGQLGLPERHFLFLTMFDASSMLQRKNPLGVLRAFQGAFEPNDANVALVMKCNSPNLEEPMMRELRAEMADRDNIFLIDRVMDRDELSSLINVSDCFVSLHRSEGFGLGPAEAMSLGKPAIITNWSGNTDYMTPDNSIGIDYELVKLGKDYGPYQAHQHWAEPDLEQASHWMKKLVGDPGLARQIGLRGQETIRRDYSAEAVGRLIKKRLAEIRRDG